MELPEDVSRQVATVLRLRPGEEIGVFDGSGTEWVVRLEHVAANGTSGLVIEVRQPDVEPAVALTLCVAVLKADRFEFVLQRCTEAGVSRFQPFVSERCVAEMPRGQKLARWERIVREAAEQSGRVMIPPLLPVAALADLPTRADLQPLVVLWEAERSVGLREVLDAMAIPRRAKSATAVNSTGRTSSRPSLSLVVGPEGGLAEREVQQLTGAGVRTASIGPRVFRAETAALVATAAVMYHRGELGR